MKIVRGNRQSGGLIKMNELKKHGHTCHATDCLIRVPPEMLFCKTHWFQLPKGMRDRVWRAYRPGQCDDWAISHEYAEAARAAVRYIADKEGLTPDLKIYDMLDPGLTKNTEPR